MPGLAPGKMRRALRGALTISSAEAALFAASAGAFFCAIIYLVFNKLPATDIAMWTMPFFEQ